MPTYNYWLVHFQAFVRIVLLCCSHLLPAFLSPSRNNPLKGDVMQRKVNKKRKERKKLKVRRCSVCFESETPCLPRLLHIYEQCICDWRRICISQLKVCLEEAVLSTFVETTYKVNNSFVLHCGSRSEIEGCSSESRKPKWIFEDVFVRRRPACCTLLPHALSRGQ